MRAALSLVLASCLAFAVLPAQSMAAYALVKKADEALGKKDQRGAIRCLRDAHWALYRLDAKARRKHRDLSKEITQRLKELDRETSRLLRLQETYVRGLLRILDSYRDDKHLDAARELQQHIDQISTYILTDAQRVPVAAEGGEVGAADGAAGEFARWFSGSWDPYGETWRTGEGQVSGPIDTKEDFTKKPMSSAMLLGSRRIVGDFDAEIVFDMRLVLRVGLIFGSQVVPQLVPQELYLAELSVEDHGVTLHRYQAGKFTDLTTKAGTKRLNLAATRLQVKLRGQQVEVLFGPDRAKLSFKLPTVPQGSFGIYTVLDTKRRGPVHCRGLRITPVKAEKADKDK